MIVRTSILLSLLLCLGLAACGGAAQVDQTITRTVIEKKLRPVLQAVDTPASEVTTSTQQTTTQTQDRTPAGQVTDCGNYTRNGSYMIITSARNMSCAQAFADVNANSVDGSSDPSRGFTTDSGFRCDLSQPADSGPALVLRCVKGSQAYRLMWGD